MEEIVKILRSSKKSESSKFKGKNQKIIVHPRTELRTPRPDHRQLKLKFVMWYSQPARRQIVDHVYLFLRLKEDGIMANWPST